MHPKTRDHYDFIIAGAGCAGLSLVTRLILSRQFKNKKILLADRQPKIRNDRTWCFWEKGEGFFEKVVSKKWDKLWFYSGTFSNCFNINPYQYKMIRGIDFYNHCKKIIQSDEHVDVAYGNITEVDSNPKGASLALDGKKITAELIFNSIPSAGLNQSRNGHHLLQHFKGWVIETNTPVFHTEEATLMDFRVDQSHGTSFVYIMPLTENRALVEYTLFTANLLQQETYDEALTEYISRFFPGVVYKVVEEEFGVIPMTSQDFAGRNGNIIHVGTAGGQTKASTGYTFQNIQKHSSAIVEELLKPQSGLSFKPPRRFHFYDRVLLNVLATGKCEGSQLFSTMFKRNHIHRIFRFLDNESTLPEELKIISTLPFFPFLTAGFQETVKIN